MNDEFEKEFVAPTEAELQAAAEAEAKKAEEQAALEAEATQLEAVEAPAVEAVEAPAVEAVEAPKNDFEIQQAEAVAANELALIAEREAVAAREAAEVAKAKAEREAAEAEEAKKQSAIESAEAEEAARLSVQSKSGAKVCYQDVAAIWGGLELVNAGVSQIRSASLAGKSAAAEDFALQVRELLAAQTSLLHKLFAEIERVKREGFCNG